MLTTPTSPRRRARLLLLTLVASCVVARASDPHLRWSRRASDRICGLVDRRRQGRVDFATGAFTFLPGGKIVYLERATGAVRILDPQTKQVRGSSPSRGQRRR